MKLKEQDINKLIDIWHNDASILCELWEFLGWSEPDYSKWVSNPQFKPESTLDNDELGFIFSVKGNC